MAAVTEEQLEKLAPYLEGSMPDARGEQEMFCVLHPDTRRSASINREMGVWYCHAGCGGGSIRQLVDSCDTWVPMAGRGSLVIGAPPNGDEAESAEVRGSHLEKDVEDWHERLMEEPGQRRRLFRLRGINRTTIQKAKIGFDGRYFKIPVFSPDRRLWNVRTYDPSPRNGRRKIWGVRGMNRPRIYPAGILDRAEPGDALVFCEGEWDALFTLQSGYLAVTYTCGAGKPWRPEWNVGFVGLKVFLCHDADAEGEKGNRIVGDALCDFAEVFQCHLPFPITPKHGKDMTDLLLEAEEPALVVGELLSKATPYERSTG